MFQEEGKSRKKAINDVRRWVKSQSHIKRVRLDSSFILRFLRMQKFETNAACDILEKYLTMRCQHPAWFHNLDCRVSSFILKSQLFIITSLLSIKEFLNYLGFKNFTKTIFFPFVDKHPELTVLNFILVCRNKITETRSKLRS